MSTSSDADDESHLPIELVWKDGNPWRDPQSAPPEDIVPPDGPRGLTREALIQQNNAVGTVGEYEIPGEVLLDPDGVPVGVGPSSVGRTYIGATFVTRAQLEALGLTEEEVPNVKIVEL